MTATGAFLLLAAAAVFIAVQWNTFTDGMKFAIISSLSGGMLIAGRRMRKTLPATASVVYHLGAFLLPVIGAALLTNLRAEGRTFLLGMGLIAAVGFTLLNRSEDSVFLKWGAGAGVVVLAIGIGGYTGAPGLVLVGFALTAYRLHYTKAATTWALIAGLAPLIALIERFVAIHSPVVQQLGLLGSDTRLASIATGMAAAFILGRQAQQEHDLRFAALAGLCGVIGVSTGLVELQPTPGISWMGAAAVFLGLEIVAHLVREDPFWAKPAHVLTMAVEIVAGFIVTGAVCAAVPLTWLGYQSFDPAPLLAGGLAAAAWFLADLRRRETDNTPAGIALLVGGGWLPASLGMAGAAFAGAVFGSASLVTGGAVLLAFAAFFVLSGRPGGHPLAVLLATAAPALAYSSPLVAALFALTGSVIVAGAAIVRARMSTSTAPGEAALLSLSTLFPLMIGMTVAIGSLGPFAILVIGAATAWSLGLMLDRATDDPKLRVIGWLPRAGAVFTLAFGPALDPWQLALLAGGLTAAALLDGLRRSDPAIAGIAAITMPVTTVAVVLALGGTWSTVGIVFCAVAAAAGAAHLLVPAPWKLAALATMATHAAVGLWLTAQEPKALGICLILLGGLGAAYAVRFRQIEASFLGLVLAVFGIWIELASYGVAAVDAYVAPVTALLVLAGWRARQEDSTGSWVAYAPAVALLGGTALFERMVGHGWEHAVAAGAVAVVAVLAGGIRRLAGPLLVGTAILVVLTGFETFAVNDLHVPTPVWLAAGGSVLMAAGIAMERHDKGPVETGRRLVDVVHERFS